MPLVDRLSGLLGKIELVMGCSVGLKMLNALAAGAPPWTPLGKLMHDASQTSYSWADGKGGGLGAMPQTMDKKN